MRPQAQVGTQLALHLLTCSRQRRSAPDQGAASQSPPPDLSDMIPSMSLPYVRTRDAHAHPPATASVYRGSESMLQRWPRCELGYLLLTRNFSQLHKSAGPSAPRALLTAAAQSVHHAVPATLLLAVSGIVLSALQSTQNYDKEQLIF